MDVRADTAVVAPKRLGYDPESPSPFTHGAERLEAMRRIEVVGSEKGDNGHSTRTLEKDQVTEAWQWQPMDSTRRAEDFFATHQSRSAKRLKFRYGKIWWVVV
jgi:hypothetical protein